MTSKYNQASKQSIEVKDNQLGFHLNRILKRGDTGNKGMIITSKFQKKVMERHQSTAASACALVQELQVVIG